MVSNFLFALSFSVSPANCIESNDIRPRSRKRPRDGCANLRSVLESGVTGKSKSKRTPCLKYRLSHKTCRLMSHFEFNLIFVMLDTSRSRKEHDWTLGMKSAAIKENSFHITYLIYSFRWHTIAFTLSKVLLVSEHGEWKGGTLISLLDRTVATGDFSWVMT